MRRLAIIFACVATTAVTGWLVGTASSDTSAPAAAAPTPGASVVVLGTDGEAISCSSNGGAVASRRRGTELRVTIPRRPPTEPRQRGKAKAPRHGRRARAANEETETYEGKEPRPYTYRCGPNGGLEAVQFNEAQPPPSACRPWAPCYE